MNKKTKTIIGWVLAGLLTALFVFSGIGKLSGSEQAVNGFKEMGFSDNERIYIAVVEILCAILFLIPRSGVLGTLLLIGYMGGTIVVHLIKDLPFIINIIIGVLIGLTAYIRFPEIGSRLFKN